MRTTKNKPAKKEFRSTYERLVYEDSKFEDDLNKCYRDFLLSELLIAIMEEDHISIRKLAQEAGVSPSLIQDLRTGKKDNLTLRSFSNIMDALGYDIILHKRKRRARAPTKLRMAPFHRSRTSTKALNEKK